MINSVAPPQLLSNEIHSCGIVSSTRIQSKHTPNVVNRAHEVQKGKKIPQLLVLRVAVPTRYRNGVAAVEAIALGVVVHDNRGADLLRHGRDALDGPSVNEVAMLLVQATTNPASGVDDVENGVRVGLLARREHDHIVPLANTVQKLVEVGALEDVKAHVFVLAQLCLTQQPRGNNCDTNALK